MLGAVESSEARPLVQSGPHTPTRPRGGTTGTPREPLGAVRAVIPEHCYERSTCKATAAIVRAVLVYAAAIALLVAAHAWWLIVPLWALAGLALSSLFILAHDAAHGALFASRRANRTVGRLLMLPHLHAFEGWVLGHNRLHHGHTARETMDFVWHPLTVAEYRSLSRPARLRHRIEWGPFGAGLYYVRAVWWDRMMTFRAPARGRRAIRRDVLFVTAFGFAGLVALVLVSLARGGTLAEGVLLWLKVAIVPWLVFMWSIGWTVHVHHIGSDLPWTPRRDWNAFRGQVEATTILHAPAWLNFFYLNIFLHVPHHVDVRIPFHALPEAAAAIAAEYGDSVRERPLRFRDYLRDVHRCKLYDFDRQRWLPYAAARGSVPATEQAEPAAPPA